jgi:hypothetical protein
MLSLCDSLHLLHDDANVVRVPMLIKGKIVAPPKVTKEDVERAFAGKGDDATYALLDGAQVLREPIVDRRTMQHTGDWQYQVLARFDPIDLIERDEKELVSGLYALPFSEVLDYMRGLTDVLARNADLVERVREISRKTAQHPDLFHDAAFSAFPLILSADVASAAVDAELAWNGTPGRSFLDGWVEVEAQLFPGLTSLLGSRLFGAETPIDLGESRAELRAMPTRQLHITAGNAPAIPVFSMLRALATKGAAVIKSPYGAIMPGALAALAAVAFAPDHPITRHLSLVYWRGGDQAVEDVLLSPMAFDRVVVWGAPDAVKSVQARTGMTRTVTFNPRYGLSLIGKEAFSGSLREVAIKASLDALIWNQKACIASFVQYVEGSMEDAEAFARELERVLAEWDAAAPNYVSPSAAASLRRMRRGKYLDAVWHTNKTGDRASSNVIVMNGKFDMLDHPMSRTMIVRRVDRLEDVIETLHHGVASIGVYPEPRRRALRDLALARGVSNVLPLGQVERTFGGMPHDGMRVLGDLVDWKHS